LAAARPRLLRVARAQGVARDDADDVVQETLLIAWRRFDSLRSPSRFDAWLDGICYHLCQHYARRARAIAVRQVQLAGPTADDVQGNTAPEGLTDPQAFDPAEELDRQDLETLLDRALGYLADNTREALELCYLAEVPQREAAARLSMTVSALEARLHRARRELRRLLSGELRAQAETFGLALDADASAGWRETREWCNFCGQRRLRGTFEHLPGGRVNLRLRCPECSRRFGSDLYSTGGVVALSGVRSFRPAYKRLVQLLERHYTQDYAHALVNGWQACPGCGRLVATKLVEPGGGIAAFPDQYRLVLECPRCRPIVSPAAFAAYGALPTDVPAALQFIKVRSRWVMKPDMLTEFEGEPAIRFRLADVSSAARLTILADVHSLRIFTMVEE
jgi:RNA polymerase sigma-70 factor (ECF subfamily)